jgi:hypothetical protein
MTDIYKLDQAAMYHIFKCLVRARIWMDVDKFTVEAEEAEVSVVLWAIKLGPHGQMKGREEGRTNFGILADAEEAYVPKDGDEKEALLTFTKDVRAWGYEQLAKANDELEAAEGAEKEHQSDGATSLLKAEITSSTSSQASHYRFMRST